MPWAFVLACFPQKKAQGLRRPSVEAKFTAIAPPGLLCV